MISVIIDLCQGWETSPLAGPTGPRFAGWPGVGYRYLLLCDI